MSGGKGWPGLLAAATGEHLEMHIKYERGVGNKGNLSDTKFYSAKPHEFCSAGNP